MSQGVAVCNCLPKTAWPPTSATPDGAVWYSESGAEPNTIVRFDPRSRTFARWSIPSGGGVVRHMVATPDGDIYIACSGVDKVGVVKAGR